MRSKYHAAGCCVSGKGDAFHTCHQQLIKHIWPQDVCVCVKLLNIREMTTTIAQFLSPYTETVFYK